MHILFTILLTFVVILTLTLLATIAMALADIRSLLDHWNEEFHYGTGG